MGWGPAPTSFHLCSQKPRVMAGTVKLEDKQRLAQEEESEAKRLAIMMMKKREKYLYNKIMFGKRRKIREVSPCHLPDVAMHLPAWPGPPVRPSPRPVWAWLQPPACPWLLVSLLGSGDRSVPETRPAVMKDH